MTPPEEQTIILGSISPLKMSAVWEACREIDLRVRLLSSKSNSKVRLQPVGFGEIMTGAKNRALGARSADYPDALLIGMENGLLSTDFPSSTIDISVTALYSPAKKKWYYGTSPGIEFPRDDVLKAKKIGFDRITVGQVMKGRNSKISDIDPHSFLTEGRMSRSHLMAIGVKIALLAALTDDGSAAPKK